MIFCLYCLNNAKFGSTVFTVLYDAQKMMWRAAIWWLIWWFNKYFSLTSSKQGQLAKNFRPALKLQAKGQNSDICYTCYFKNTIKQICVTTVSQLFTRVHSLSDDHDLALTAFLRPTDKTLISHNHGDVSAQTGQSAAISATVLAQKRACPSVTNTNPSCGCHQTDFAAVVVGCILCCRLRSC